MKRFVASLAGVCSFALVATGLAVPTAMADEPAPAAVQEVSSRPDAMSAVLTAKALGKRIEDLSQRTEREQVFANPDGTWTSESTALTRFSEKDGKLVPIEDLGTLESAGAAMTGSGTVLSVADGTETVGSGPAKDSVALANLEGTGELKGKKLELGWEGKLPTPEVKDNVATYEQGVSVPVEEPGAGEPAKGQAPVAEGSAEASVTVEPTLTGFSHRTVLDQAPEGDVVLRFPLKLSKGLKAERDEKSGDLRVVDEKGKVVFFAPAPSMWDAKVDEASGLHPAETKVETTLEIVDGVQTLVLHVDQAWLKASERQYPVTIDPTWTAGVSDTWVQTGETGSKAGDPELRVGTYDSGAHKARSFLNNGSQALAGKKILKAELKMYNWHSWSCTSAPVKIQRLTGAWSSTDVRWTAQPPATTSGEGTLNVSKGYSASCDNGYVYYPMTPIAQYWADNPKEIFGVRLIASDETNNFAWKRYRSANYATTPAQAPAYVITYASYPGAPSAVSFNSGESSKDASGKLWVKTKTPTFKATVADPDGGKARAGFDLSGGATWDKQVGNDVSPSGVSSYKGTLEEGKTYTTKAWTSNYQLWSKTAGPASTFTVDTIAPSVPSVTSVDGGYQNNSWKDTQPAKNSFKFSSNSDVYQFRVNYNNGMGLVQEMVTSAV